MRAILPDPFFNPVEGYALGTWLRWRNQKKKFGFGVHPRYGFGWDRLNVELNAHLGRSGNRERSSEPAWEISGGRSVRQFNDNPAIEPWISTFTNLFTGQNFIRLYEREYVELAYRRSFSDAFRLEGEFRTENRRGLLNSANNNWFGLRGEEVYAQNTPINQLGTVFGADDATTLRLAATFRPGLRYEIENGRKRLIDFSSPTIGVALYQGINDLLGGKADFTRVEASYEHRFRNGRKGDVDLFVRAGAFLNEENRASFPDFKHFATSEITLTSLDPIGSYRLLPYYLESTQEEYLEFYGHYQFRKFLLTRIWKLHLMGLKEDLFVNYLRTPSSDNYTEVGYSIDNIFRFFRLEFVTAFRDFQYDDFGVRISVASSLLRGEL